MVMSLGNGPCFLKNRAWIHSLPHETIDMLCLRSYRFLVELLKPGQILRYSTVYKPFFRHSVMFNPVSSQIS